MATLPAQPGPISLNGSAADKKKQNTVAACFGKTMNTWLKRGACSVLLPPYNPEANSGIFQSDLF